MLCAAPTLLLPPILGFIYPERCLVHECLWARERNKYKEERWDKIKGRQRLVVWTVARSRNCGELNSTLHNKEHETTQSGLLWNAAWVSLIISLAQYVFWDILWNVPGHALSFWVSVSHGRRAISHYKTNDYRTKWVSLGANLKTHRQKKEAYTKILPHTLPPCTNEPLRNEEASFLPSAHWVGATPILDCFDPRQEVRIGQDSPQLLRFWEGHRQTAKLI